MRMTSCLDQRIDLYLSVRSYLQDYVPNDWSFDQIYLDFLKNHRADGASFAMFKAVCKDFGLKFKLLKKAKSNKPRDQRRIYQYYNYIMPLLENESNFVGFFDVSSISEKSFKQRGWSLPSTNCTIEARYGYSSLHLLALISNTGDFFSKFIKGNIINYDILDFLNEVIRKVRNVANFDHFYIILDNCKQHRTEYMLNFAKEQKLVFVFTVPRSPELNPAEYLFRYLKSSLRQKFVLSK